jgi:flagellar biosynthesis component FlhA
MAAASKTAPASAPKPARGIAPKSQTVALKPVGGAKKGSRFGNLSDIGAPLAVLGIVMAMIMPMPAFMLDILISANITIAVIVMLVSMYITKPVEFSVFPTTLLLLTLFRLALNISSTRLILMHGNGGTRAAGQVID